LPETACSENAWPSRAGETRRFSVAKSAGWKTALPSAISAIAMKSIAGALAAAATSRPAANSPNATESARRAPCASTTKPDAACPTHDTA